MWRFEGWHGARWRHRRAEVRSITHSDNPTEFLHSHGSPTLVVNISSSQITAATAAAALAEFKPEVIATRSPAWLAWLSLYLTEHRSHAVHPRVVFTRGEQLFPEQRQAMIDAFGVPVVDVYATHEFLVFGGECEHGRMHLASEMGIVEVLKEGRAAAAGEAGSVVLTSLWNHSFPFIRYDIGDIACIDGAPCPCGRTLPTWHIIGGRQRDLVATRSGYAYVPAYLLTAPHWRGKIIEFQFLQETRDAVVARIVRGPAFTEADTERLRADLSAYFKGELDVEIVFLDSIGLTAGGKFRFVVSKVPVEV
jgi:phenylacetate-CoA ligase